MYSIITSSQQAGHLLGVRCIVSRSLRAQPHASFRGTGDPRTKRLSSAKWTNW